MYKIKKLKEPYLTEADRKRIADLDHNPWLEDRKLKVGITLKHPSIKAEIYIVCYGKNKEMLKQYIAEHLDFFQKHDKQWKLINVEELKGQID